jgi:hypothetical protein
MADKHQPVNGRILVDLTNSGIRSQGAGFDDGIIVDIHRVLAQEVVTPGCVRAE